MKSTGSVANYCLSNAIHGIGQSIKSSSERVPVAVDSDRSFVRSFSNFKRRSHLIKKEQVRWPVTSELLNAHAR